jgi:hypothetical protein
VQQYTINIRCLHRATRIVASVKDKHDITVPCKGDTVHGLVSDDSENEGKRLRAKDQSVETKSDAERLLLFLVEVAAYGAAGLGHLAHGLAGALVVLIARPDLHSARTTALLRNRRRRHWNVRHWRWDWAWLSI